MSTRTSRAPVRRSRPARKTPSRARAAPPAVGGPCPSCRSGRLDVDGCLNLVCPRCGFVAGGAFT